MAKKNSKKAKPEVTLEQLQAVAEDFNSFMVEEGEEGIDIDLDQEDLLEEVTEAAADLVEDDVITQETADTLEALGIDHVAQVGEAPEEDPEEDVDPEEDDDVDPDGESIEEMLDRAKAAKIAVPPPFRKDKEKLQAYLAKKLPATKPAGKKGKAEAKPAEKKGKAAEKPAAEKKEKKEKAEPETTVYGHRVNTMSGRIDVLVHGGKHTQEAIAGVIVKEFGRDESKAAAKVEAHLKYLTAEKGVNIIISKKGIVSAGE